jgi:biopolymer transport protein ExbB/TolQ
MNEAPYDVKSMQGDLIPMDNFFVFVRDHIYHVAPLFIVGGVAIVIALERWRALCMVYPMANTNYFFQAIREHVMTDKVAEAIALCERFAEKPVARVVRAALLRAHQPEELIEDGLVIAVGECSEQIQQRTAYLSTIANVATLLGLLGTIVGLVHSFEAIGSASAQNRSALLASGISTSMNATMLGLSVAIPCMLAFGYLMSRTNHLNAEVEQAAAKVLDLLKQRFYSNDVGTNNDRPAQSA